ncbi:MAG: mraW [Ilumatobacteraceae bacterium]|nr:mraW [Ilumatobacteraceae bacterium]
MWHHRAGQPRRETSVTGNPSPAPGPDSPDAFVHRPVMADEIVAVFATVPPGWLVDATLGGGGHTELLLEAYPHLSVIGIDRDPSALAAATRRLARFGDRFIAVHSRFDHLQTVMSTADITRPIPVPITGLSGALFDLGVSSPQLDRAERGFSYRNDAPLDMRMDTTEAWSAADVVNGYSEGELIRMLQDNGDERFAPRIARAIIAHRPIESTAELAGIIVDAIPAAARRTGGHPAKRSFQAIRIEVNGELAILPGALDDAIEATLPGGRVAVLSYHSGEDRIVKERFRSAETGDCICPPGLPCVCGAVRTVRVVRRVPKTPGEAELEQNRRAASARLRVVERLPFTTIAESLRPSRERN